MDLVDVRKISVGNLDLPPGYYAERGESGPAGFFGIEKEVCKTDHLHVGDKSGPLIGKRVSLGESSIGFSNEVHKEVTK